MTPPMPSDRPPTPPGLLRECENCGHTLNIHAATIGRCMAHRCECMKAVPPSESAPPASATTLKRGYGFHAELRRFYEEWCAKNGKPQTWTLRAEVFEELVGIPAVSPPAPSGDVPPPFTQQDVSLLADIAAGYSTVLHYDRLDDLRRRLRVFVEAPETSGARADKALAEISHALDDQRMTPHERFLRCREIIGEYLAASPPSRSAE